MANLNLLVIGGSGFVGARLTKAAVDAGWSVAYTYLKKELKISTKSFRVDIKDIQSIGACIAEIRPNIIIYCAKPSLDADEADHQAVSVDGVRQLLGLLDEEHCKFIYVSTNAVFSGKCGQYCEGDTPDADKKHDQYRHYAMARARGEQLVLSHPSNTIVVRTADVNGRDVEGKLNARLEYLVRQLLAGHAVERFSRCYMSPTLVDDLVVGLLRISSADFIYKGVLHLAGSDRISYYNFAQLLANQIGVDRELIKSDISREQDLSLNSAYTQKLINTSFLGVKDQLAQIFS
ncbi:sugar nucleotide-binding protein [Burkholderia sp. TSV86]|uniref:sugar nucleotide-binding protein n=1 Tax=Burkholderia sp. TSV86 TaxID=1385594 RepID=UPI0009E8680E|nr:sugar nucleotide-binding protein [Burkholderia sp. TSV86]